MRKIDSIIIHCSATKAGQDFTAADIDRWHRERGFNGIGYHYVVCLDGRLEKGRDISLIGAHCKGWNEHSIGICYIGGLDGNGYPADTRTNAQKRVLYQLIMDLKREYNVAQVLGHRDTSPDLNGNGVIEPYEYVKACPCFDVKEFLRNGKGMLFVLFMAPVISLMFSGCRSGEKIVRQYNRLEMDSDASTIYEKEVVLHSFALENDLEAVEEHMEQVAFILPADSMKQGRVVALKTVVERRTGKKNRMFVENSSMKKDSLCLDSRLKIREDKEVENVVSSKSGHWKTKGALLFLGAVLLYCVCKWRKLFKL